jgi:hypothetical protein
MAPKFQHRHYKAIAETLLKATPLAKDGDKAMRQWSQLCNDMATMLERDNPRFNRSRFIDACFGDYSNGRDKPR